MNRRKKLKQIIKKKDSRGKASAAVNSKKPKYISKADRERLSQQPALTVGDVGAAE
jgi:hypothetical protein